ncbi:glycine cleavage system aminomethyltransferase GcvT [Nitriliruptor alkaliphilus]|uniref:glycine cleavage system aminomethyltransferase GcvT n=1 Tax=Nitriliruptor alkaliphilus TaxID=427918 RepID=UPI00069637A7|nr:glycine cleavage system aminomethyltransferase GcvT [Nitriliruptor alkaliphilus]
MSETDAATTSSGGRASAPLRRTPLTARHEQAGAKLAPFAGWAMPISFDGVLTEHAAVRDGVGMFDVSHLGTVWITGPAATAVVGRAFTADADLIDPGGSRYALCTAEDGGILDDLIVYRLSEHRWLTVPNAANTATVVGRLRSAAAEVAVEAGPDVAAAAAGADPEPADLAVGFAVVDDASAGWAVLAVQGPRSLTTVEDALGIDAAAAPWGSVGEVALGDDAPVSGRIVLCRTGYTGEVGVELLVPGELAVGVWDALLAAGAAPCGLGARDTLRLEMGYPLHGSDLGPDVLPAEARLSWAVQLTDGDGEPRRFPGAVAITAAAASGPARRLWGVRTSGRRPLRAGSEVRRGDTVVGTTTSGGFSPTLGVGIGLAMLDAEVEPGGQVTVDVRGSQVEAEVVRPPFVDRDPKG